MNLNRRKVPSAREVNILAILRDREMVSYLLYKQKINSSNLSPRNQQLKKFFYAHTNNFGVVSNKSGSSFQLDIIKNFLKPWVEKE